MSITPSFSSVCRAQAAIIRMIVARVLSDAPVGPCATGASPFLPPRQEMPA